MRRLGIVVAAGLLAFQAATAAADAVAAACGGPSGQVRLEADGRITWDFDRTVAYGADGSRPFGVCVDDQIRHYPGYQRRN